MGVRCDAAGIINQSSLDWQTVLKSPLSLPATSTACISSSQNPPQYSPSRTCSSKYKIVRVLIFGMLNFRAKVFLQTNEKYITILFPFV